MLPEVKKEVKQEVKQEVKAVKHENRQKTQRIVLLEPLRTEVAQSVDLYTPIHVQLIYIYMYIHIYIYIYIYLCACI